eukprot:jgi/Botrbrau1/325/Bobra.0022s0284.2
MELQTHNKGRRIDFAALEGNYEDIDTPGKRLRNSPLLSHQGTGNKRLKLMPASDPNYLAHTTAIAVREGNPEGMADLFGFFAERGTENKSLRERLKDAEQKEQLARESAQRLQTELHDLQATTRTDKACYEAIIRQSKLDRSELQRKLEQSFLKAKVLEQQLQRAVEAKDEMDQGVAEILSIAETRGLQVQDIRSNSEAQIRDAQATAREATLAKGFAETACQRHIDRVNAELEGKEVVIRELVKHKEDMQKDLRNLGQAKNDLECSLRTEENRVNELEMKIKRLDSAETIVAEVESLRRQLHSQEAEIEAARHLRRHVENVSILKEKLRTAEEGSKNVETMTAKLLEAQEVALSKEQEVNRWKAALGPDNMLETPQQLLIKFGNIQTEALQKLKQFGELKAELQFSKEEAAQSKERLQTLEEELDMQKQRTTDLEACVVRLNKVVELITLERDNLRRTLEAAKIAEIKGTLQSKVAEASQQRFQDQEFISTHPEHDTAGVEANIQTYIDESEKEAASLQVQLLEHPFDTNMIS